MNGGNSNLAFEFAGNTGIADDIFNNTKSFKDYFKFIKNNLGDGVEWVSNPQKKLITGEDWNSYFKETYGAENVQWESAVSSMQDILDVPSNVTRLKPQQLAELAKKEGWLVEPLGQGRRAGIPFEEGGGMSIRNLSERGATNGEYIQYHPGSTYHDSVHYFKVLS